MIILVSPVFFRHNWMSPPFRREASATWTSVTNNNNKEEEEEEANRWAETQQTNSCHMKNNSAMMKDLPTAHVKIIRLWMLNILVM